MVESSLADSHFYAQQYASLSSTTGDSSYSYSHTLTARPYHFPSAHPPPPSSLAASIVHLLPTELRSIIYVHLFANSRVAVTAARGCYCASTATGPYHAIHSWLLSLPEKSDVRRDVQRAFTRLVLWEVHCSAALREFVARMNRLRLVEDVREVRVNVFETPNPMIRDLEGFSVFGGLRRVTFSPWQKGWTVDVPAREGSEMLCDERVVERLVALLRRKKEYEVVMDVVERNGVWRERDWRVGFVFVVRYLLPGKVLPYRWQLKVWRADLDELTIDRDWREIHLVQEATLD